MTDYKLKQPIDYRVDLMECHLYESARRGMMVCVVRVGEELHATNMSESGFGNFVYIMSQGAAVVGYGQVVEPLKADSTVGYHAFVAWRPFQPTPELERV